MVRMRLSEQQVRGMLPCRETLAVAFGAAICVLAGLLPWCEVPSATGSWIDADEMLHIVADECWPGLLARMLLLAFGLASSALLVLGREKAVGMRHLAVAVLVLFLLTPQVVLMVSPNSVRDENLVYDHVDLTIADMERSLNQQQVDWRAWQTVDMGGVGLAARVDAGHELPRLEGLGWSDAPAIVDSVLGYSNAFLNLVGAGWYLGIVGLVCWLFGAYSGDPDAARRRSGGAATAVLLGTTMLLAVMAPRFLAAAYVHSARDSVALGNYREAGLAFEQADALTPLRRFSLSNVVEEGKIDDQLLCAMCATVVTGRAALALSAGRDFAAAASYFDMIENVEPTLPGSIYWRSVANLLAGFERFNAGQYSAADVYFARALTLVPIDALGWYGRSLVQMRLGDFDRSARHLANAWAIQDRLGFRRLTLQGQLHLVRSWAALKEGNLVLAHESYSRYLTPESW
jgi:tetratricopeptide (TPR) repeat protein